MRRQRFDPFLVDSFPVEEGFEGEGDALRIRPFVSDNLFQSMYYWIDLYTSERCRNVTENATILRVDLANVVSDAYFDAIRRCFYI